MPPILADITQGRRLARMQGDGFCLHEVSYPDARQMAPHSHRTGNITLVLAGGVEEQIDHESHRCSSLSVIFKPSGAVHATALEPGTRSLVIELTREVEDLAQRRFGLLDRCDFVHDARELVTHILALWRRLRTAPNARVPIERLLADLNHARAGRPAPARPHGLQVRRAIELMGRSPASAPTSSIARQLDLHPVYLARLFRARTGVSPREFRTRRQVQHAVDRLVRTTEPLTAVALHAGFSDQAHLCRRVRLETGLTPGALRRLAAQHQV